MSDLTLSHLLNDAGQLTISIGGRLAIDTVAILRDFFLEHLPTAKSIRLDTGALEEIDLAGMQLLCSACYTALSENRSFRFSGKPAPCIAQGVLFSASRKDALNTAGLLVNLYIDLHATIGSVSSFLS